MANISEVSMPSANYRQTRKTLWRRFSFPYSIVTFAVLLLVWQVATEVFDISPIILPAPTAVMTDLVANWRLLRGYGRFVPGPALAA